MKMIVVNIELEVPNSVAKHAKRTGITMLFDGQEPRVKVGSFEADKHKTKASFEVKAINGRQ